MADAYSSWIVEWHGGRTRAWVSAWLESQTDKTATIRVQGCCNAWRITQYGRRIRLYGDGSEIGTCTDVVFSRYGSGNFGWLDKRFTVQKGKEARSITCSCLIKKEVVDGYGASGKNESRTASVGVWVPAQTLRPPSMPGKPTCKRGSAGQIVISWKNNAANAKKTQLQRMEYGGSWATVLNSSAVVADYTDSVGAGTFAYRARYGNDDGWSVWSDSSAFIVSLCAPAAPTVVFPLSGDTLSQADGNPTLRFRHNPLDNSEQTGAQLRWREQGGSAWTTLSLGTATQCTLDVVGSGDVNETIEWQVRTKGAYDGGGTAENAWSAWTAVSLFHVKTPPTVQVSVADEIAEVPVSVSWEYEDASGTQAMAELSFTDSETGEVAFSDRFDGTETVATVAASEFTPVQSHTYTVTVRCTSTSSLSCEGTAETTVRYIPPSEPVFAVMRDNGLHANIITAYDTIELDDEGNAVTAAAESFSVFRDGVCIAEGLQDSEEFLDRMPPLDVDTVYRVVAYAESGSVAEYSQTVRMPSNSFLVVNYGEGLAKVAKVRRNLSRPDGVEGEKVARTVASSRLPKVFYGTHRTRSHTATGDVWVFEDEGGEGDSARLAAFFDLESNNGDVYLRFPRGMALYATVDVSHTQDLSNANWAKVSIDWQEVSH